MKTQLIQLSHGKSTEPSASPSGGAFASIADALKQDSRRYGCWDPRRLVGVEGVSSMLGTNDDLPLQSVDMVRLVASC